MFQQATAYAPLILNKGGKISVQFVEEHPGFHDEGYQQHRADIARAALEYRAGDPVSEIAYLEEEHAMWRLLSRELDAKHELHACAEVLEGIAHLALPRDRMPQLKDVSATVERLTGFRFSPAVGLLEERDFYGSLAERRFQATQYVRHYSTPRFSAEPDMIHEIVGHGSALAVERWADIYQLVGQAIRGIQSPQTARTISRVFWFTLEYGLIRERGELKVCGASLLSSYGELGQFHNAEIRPLDVDAMATQKYRVDEYQRVLFCADSFSHLEDFLGSFLTGVVDDRPLARI